MYIFHAILKLTAFFSEG